MSVTSSAAGDGTVSLSGPVNEVLDKIAHSHLGWTIEAVIFQKDEVLIIVYNPNEDID